MLLALYSFAIVALPTFFWWATPSSPSGVGQVHGLCALMNAIFVFQFYVVIPLGWRLFGGGFEDKKEIAETRAKYFPWSVIAFAVWVVMFSWRT